jgi:uncharacterized membrane protein
MGSLLLLIGSFALGVAVSQLLDPVRGRTRRALIRDKAISATHVAGDALDTTSRDVANRGRGALAVLRSWLRPAHVTDEVLVERVRARIGGVVSHPHAIRVTAQEGRVILAGPILADEVDAAVRRAAAVRGVREVDNQLEAHETADGIPDLQGQPGRRREGARFELWQQQWSPTARLLTGVAGASLGAWGGYRGGPARIVTGAAGLTLLARAITNLELKRLFGVAAGRHAVVVHKTIHVAAPLEEVYDLWTRYEDFPTFMANVLEVRRSASGQAHWKVAGPGRMPVTFETVETRVVPNELIAWKTVEGSPVAHAGVVRFDENPEGTRIHLQMSYNPPGGALGHGIAVLLGADPRQSMHGDLVRFKSLLEDQTTSARGRRVDREALG